MAWKCCNSVIVAPPRVLGSVSTTTEFVEPRGADIVQFDAPHHEHELENCNQIAMRDAGVAHRLGAGAFGEAQIVGMIDDAAGVGVLVIDADLIAMHGWRVHGRRSTTRSSDAGSFTVARQQVELRAAHPAAAG